MRGAVFAAKIALGLLLLGNGAHAEDWPMYGLSVHHAFSRTGHRRAIEIAAAVGNQAGYGTNPVPVSLNTMPFPDAPQYVVVP